MICENCAIQASKSYKFKQQCLKSNDLLKEKLLIKNESQGIIKKEAEENYEFEDIEEDDEELETVYEITEEEEQDRELELENQEENDCQIEILEDGFDFGVSNDDDSKELGEIQEDLETIDDKPEKTVVFKKSRVPRKKRQSLRVQNISFKCKVCDKQLSNAGSFKYHMQLHSDDVPFLCCECGEKFKTKNAYDGHMTTHNNTHTCEVCGKCYRQAASLRSHMLSHTGEKLFLCILCGKSMTQKSGLKVNRVDIQIVRFNLIFYSSRNIC